MAKILVIAHDLPVITTRRNSVPALFWPNLSKKWTRCAKALWSAEGVKADQLLPANTIRLSNLLSERINRMMIGESIHLVITDTALLANEPTVFQLITRHPYQPFKIQLLLTDWRLADKLTNHKIIGNLINTVTDYHNRSAVLNPPSVSLRYIHWQPNDLVIYFKDDFLNVNQVAGVHYFPIVTDAEANYKIFTSERRKFQFTEAITGNFNTRLRLLTEEADQVSSAQTLVTILETPLGTNYDNNLSLTIDQLISQQHQVRLIGIPDKVESTWWPIISFDCVTDEPTHLELLANGMVDKVEVIDYIRQYVYEKNIPLSRLAEQLTKVRAHSSVG